MLNKAQKNKTISTIFEIVAIKKGCEKYKPLHATEKLNSRDNTIGW